MREQKKKNGLKGVRGDTNEGEREGLTRNFFCRPTNRRELWPSPATPLWLRFCTSKNPALASLALSLDYFQSLFVLLATQNMLFCLFLFPRLMYFSHRKRLSAEHQLVVCVTPTAGVGVGARSRFSNLHAVTREEPRAQAYVWSTRLAATAHEPGVNARRGRPEVAKKSPLVRERAGGDTRFVQGALEPAVCRRGGHVRDSQVHAIAHARSHDNLCGWPTATLKIVFTGTLEDTAVSVRQRGDAARGADSAGSDTLGDVENAADGRCSSKLRGADHG